MASMRKLRRRLRRWDRYGSKTYWNPRVTTAINNANRTAHGHTRAAQAYCEEYERRRVRTVYWPTTTGDI